MRIQRAIPIPPGQPFTIDRFRPEDAPGIASLFLTVYGADYPVQAYYDPEQIVALHAKGDLHSVVARTATGDIVGHGALYRSSPPHALLYEVGQLIVPPAYRTSFAAFRINAYLMETLPQTLLLDGIFGEAVCHHTATQKSSRHHRCWETALELDLLPRGGDQDAAHPGGRVSCLFVFRNYRDRRRPAHIPPVYQEQIAFILRGTGLDRDFRAPAAALPDRIPSDMSVAWFDAARVGRFTVPLPGTDFASRMDAIEAAAQERQICVRQVFLSLASPWIGPAVSILRERGYFLGGYLPRWFDADALLMQKVTPRPNFDGIKLHTEMARQLLAYVRGDWSRTR